MSPYSINRPVIRLARSMASLPSSSPTDPSGAHHPSRMPEDLLHEATRRLALLSGISFVFSSVMFVIVSFTGVMDVGCPAIRNTVFPIFLLVSGAMFILARTNRIACPRLHKVASVYQFVAGSLIAFLVNSRPWPEMLLPAWSPVAVWVLIYPMMIPTAPVRTLIASTLTAAMDPISVVLLAASGAHTMPASDQMILRFAPNVLSVIAGVAVSQGLFRVGAKLSKARELGAYRLTERLGKGGMGEVWLASHRLLRRPAAIKLIRPELLGAEDGAIAGAVSSRFEREAQATAQLESPHTIAIYDFGLAGDGTFYYVMEYLRGLDLSTLVKRMGPLPAERVVHLLRQACHSLNEAHGAGLIHRDIKPGNLLTCRYGPDVDFVKVLDFGLVKQRAAAPTDETMLTRQGAATGTPAFMSPEMILGEREIDGRADIYALGCVAYYLLTGQLVFDSDSPMKTMVMHAKDAPPPMADRTELAIPPALETVVQRCLAKDPADRPQSAGDLAQALVAIEFDHPWTEQRAREWWDTHRPA